ncbi:hypothetical protein PsorP6_019503 [Peronosclerospora sorghi]|nr:hypothetical protein PsorP6_019503 [Peronosclerospora sorghi]
MLGKIAKEAAEKRRVLENTVNEQIMARNTDGMTETQLCYYRLKQAPILRDLEKEKEGSNN